MAFRYTLIGAVTLAVTSLSGAQAQAQAQSPFPPVGQERQSPFPPVGREQQSPFPPVGQRASPFPSVGQQSPFPQAGQPQQSSPCVEQFLPLRQEVDKRFEATKAGIAKKGTAPEICNLLTKFSQAETALMKFVEKSSDACPFPADLLTNIKASNAKTEVYRKQACTAAAAPARQARPAAPTLSDALSPPVASKDNTKTGRGTLDSLGGNPLAR
jgi:hypothetical protein